MDLEKKVKKDEKIEIRIDGGKEDEEKKIKTSGSNEFKQFDIIPKVFYKDDSIFSDHYYYRDKPAMEFSIRTNNCIGKEWCILEQGLPDSIFVKVYEGRKDLLKAVIIGPKGTPYHDGLFFIDIQFPCDYPNRPPKLHHRTIGMWCDKKYFPLPQTCWDPCQSTVLQVLVAIYQNLIFSTRLIDLKGDIVAYKETRDDTDIHSSFSDSYFWWRRNNMSIFVSSCMNMVAVLKNPPKCFEEFVAQHFRDRAKIILNACLDYNRTYKPGYPKNTLEYYEAAATTTGNPTKRTMTTIFYGEMYGAYDRLLKAFIKNGSDSLENYKVAMDPRVKVMGYAFLISIVVSFLVTLVAKKFHWLGIP